MAAMAVQQQFDDSATTTMIKVAQTTTGMAGVERREENWTNRGQIPWYEAAQFLSAALSSVEVPFGYLTSSI